MEPFRIIETEETPGVVLDPVNGKFEFTGCSLPEDVSSFYIPVLEWFGNYANNPNKNTVVSFKLLYFNTASSKVILDILQLLEKIAKEGKDVRIRWFYPKKDDDMADAGIEYADMVELPFEQIAY